MLRIPRLTVALALSCEVLLTGALTTSAATTTIAANWTQSGYNAQHTGYNPLEKTLTRLNVGHLVQAFSAPVQDAGPPAIVVNGIAYVSNTGGADVDAVNATTGAPVWTNFNSIGAQSTSPAFSTGRVWVGVDDPGVEAFDAKTGTPFATGSANDLFFAPPSASGGFVYAGGSSGVLAAFNASTGSVRWQRLIGPLNAGPSLETPAVSLDGTALYVGTGFGDVLKVNASNGATIWKHHLDNFICGESAVTVAGSMLYVGGCKLYALSAATGSVLWHSNSFGNGVTAPVVANGLVFASAQGANSGIAAFNALSGKRVWTYPDVAVGATFDNGALTVANGVVYYVNGSGKFRVLNSSTGALIRTYFPPTGANYEGPPIEVNGMVYVISLDTSTFATTLVALKP
jgi:outer membrane protein assembly factor BamB